MDVVVRLLVFVVNRIKVISIIFSIDYLLMVDSKVREWVCLLVIVVIWVRIIFVVGKMIENEVIIVVSVVFFLS